MNYYERHIGDFIRDTVSLTMIEDGAYNRLIDQCYQTERPLPTVKAMVYRLARATTPAEKKAVDFVLEAFFVLGADGYRQKRVDAEIARYQDKQRKAKASADARWSHSGRNANASANASPDAMRTHMPTQSEGNAHQTPDTRHQEKEKAAATNPVVGPPALPDPPEVVPPLSKPVIERALELVVMARKQGVQIAPSNPHSLEWAKRGISDAQLLTAIGRAEETRQTRGQAQPVNAGYLNAVLADVVEARPTYDLAALQALVSP